MKGRRRGEEEEEEEAETVNDGNSEAMKTFSGRKEKPLILKKSKREQWGEKG